MMSGPLLLVAFAAVATGVVAGAKLPRLWIFLTLIGTAAALSAALCALSGTADMEWRSAIMAGGEPLHFRLDGMSAVFLVLLPVVGGAGAVYSREYWPDQHYPESAPRGRGCWSALLLCMGLVLLSSNGLHFLIAWELFTVSAWCLVTLDRRKPEVRAAGWLSVFSSGTALRRCEGDSETGNPYKGAGAVRSGNDLP